MTQLRWILLGIGLLMMAAIWWWMTRRPAQARGKPEITITPVSGGRMANPVEPPPADASGDAGPEPGWRASREWGVPPLEPLSIKTAAADRGAGELDLPVMTGSRSPAREEAGAPLAEMRATRDEGAAELELPQLTAGPVPQLTAGPEPAPQPVPQPLRAAPAVPARLRVSPLPPPASPAAVPTPAPALKRAAASVAAAEVPEKQRIITMRVSAAGDSLWPGARLAEVFESIGLTHGRYQVFHRRHPDGRTLFCVASLVEPGIFDPARMPVEQYRGVSLFAVLPGPIPPLQTLDLLLGTAHEMAQQLAGVVQDGKGQPLTLQRASALREDVARFQATLS